MAHSQLHGNIISKDNLAHPVKTEAIVTDIRSESPTVRGLTLQICNPGFSFKAGQWVDMFIPGIQIICGFSMYSSPKQLKEKGTIELGVQFSDWPPTFWMHKECQINSKVEVKVGGDLFYDPVAGEEESDLLLIAGGVGINPLASILFHANDLHNAYNERKEGYRPGKIRMLLSAKTKDELLYKAQLDSVSAANPQVNIKYFTTKEQPFGSSNVQYGRITPDTLRSSLSELNKSTLKVFLCGPSSMIDGMEEMLLTHCGLSQKQILYEKWWRADSQN